MNRPVDERRWRELGNDILTELRSLRTVLLRTQEQVKGIRDAQETSNRQYCPSPKVIAEVRLPEGVKTQKEESECKEDSKYRTHTLFVQWLTFGAVAVYAVFTFYLWHDANTNFKEDERAWVGFKFVEGSVTLTIGKSFLVPTQLTNTGKTPARNIYGKIRVGVVKRGESLDFSYAPGHTVYAVSAGTMFPNGSITESFEAMQHGPDKAEAIILTKPMLDSIFSGDSIIIVHGRITYTDIFGTEHWTTYCRYVLHPEMISPECMAYNDADNNK